MSERSPVFVDVRTIGLICRNFLFWSPPQAQQRVCNTLQPLLLAVKMTATSVSVSIFSVFSFHSLSVKVNSSTLTTGANSDPSIQSVTIVDHDRDSNMAGSGSAEPSWGLSHQRQEEQTISAG